MSDLPPLHSERHNRGRRLDTNDLAQLVWKAVARTRSGLGLFQGRIEGFSAPDDRRYRAEIADVDEYLMQHLKTSAITGKDLLRPDCPIPLKWDRDLLFDLIELLYLDCVSRPTFVSGEFARLTVPNGFDQEAGKAAFRAEINSALAFADPPLELLQIGQIVEADAPHAELYENPLPDGSPPEIADPVAAAMRQFLSRGATEEDKRAAVKLLMDVLERIRPEVKETMLRKDEADLFNLANNFALRHYDRQQKADYDRNIWHDWTFHVCLATIRAVVAVRDREGA